MSPSGQESSSGAVGCLRCLCWLGRRQDPPPVLWGFTHALPNPQIDYGEKYWTTFWDIIKEERWTGQLQAALRVGSVKRLCVA